MTILDLKKSIVECGNGFYFFFNGKQCGVEPNVQDSIITFESWYGTKLKKYDNFSEVISDKFFGGKSLTELLSEGVIQ
jgi:hypothetical protein